MGVNMARTRMGKVMLSQDEVAFIQRLNEIGETVISVGEWVRNVVTEIARTRKIPDPVPVDEFASDAPRDGVPFRLTPMEQQMIDDAKGPISRSSWMRDMALRVAYHLLDEKRRQSA